MGQTGYWTGTHVYAAPQLGRNDPFVRAARHSRRVRQLRIVLPVAVGCALLAVVLISTFNPWRVLSGLPVQVGDVVISNTKITMEAPRLSGYTPDKRAYELTAKAAAQDLKNPTLVELRDMLAKVEMQDNVTVTMTAASGLYDTKDSKLKLNESIVLQSSSGYEAHLSDADVDIRKGTVTSENPVAVKLLNGDLNAQRLSITEQGASVLFHGGVSMNLMLGNGKAGQAPAETDQGAASGNAAASATDEPANEAGTKP